MANNGTTHLVACACAYLKFSDTLPESQESRSESNEPHLQKAKQSKLAIKQKEDASWRDLDHLVRINAVAAIWTAGRCSKTYNPRKDGARQAENRRYSGDHAVAVEARIGLMILAVPVHENFRSSNTSMHIKRQEYERIQAGNCFRLR